MRALASRETKTVFTSAASSLPTKTQFLLPSTARDPDALR
jgi:hypothetical protein